MLLWCSLALAGEPLVVGLRPGAVDVPALRVELAHGREDAVAAALEVALDQWAAHGGPAEAVTLLKSAGGDPDAWVEAEAAWVLSVGPSKPISVTRADPVTVALVGPWVVVHSVDGTDTFDLTGSPAQLSGALAPGAIATVERLLLEAVERESGITLDPGAPPETFTPDRDGVTFEGFGAVKLPWDLVPLSGEAGVLVDAWLADPSPPVVLIGGLTPPPPVTVPDLRVGREEAFRLACRELTTGCDGDPERQVRLHLRAEAHAGATRAPVTVTAYAFGDYVQLDAVGGTGAAWEAHTLLGPKGAPVPFDSLWKPGAMPAIAERAAAALPSTAGLDCARGGALGLTECRVGWSVSPVGLALAFDGDAPKGTVLAWPPLRRYLSPSGPGAAIKALR